MRTEKEIRENLAAIEGRLLQDMLLGHAALSDGQRAYLTSGAMTLRWALEPSEDDSAPVQPYPVGTVVEVVGNATWEPGTRTEITAVVQTESLGFEYEKPLCAYYLVTRPNGTPGSVWHSQVKVVSE